VCGFGFRRPRPHTHLGTYDPETRHFSFHVSGIGFASALTVNHPDLGKATPCGDTPMKTAPPEVVPRLVLEECKAAELMTPSPVSIRECATVREAIELLTHRGISGAPVIDRAGRPVGVVSRADVLVHDREAVDYPVPADGEKPGADRVRDIMTPAVFCVSPDAPASRVVRELTELKIHRLFVVDELGVLVGVISVLDVLRRLTNP
jgi:CBS domain-containing protein